MNFLMMKGLNFSCKQKAAKFAADYSFYFVCLFNFSAIFASAMPDEPLREPINNTYLIYSANDLISICNEVNKSNDFLGYKIILMDDISLNGIDFSSIGDLQYKFNGVFDGNEHNVDYLYSAKKYNACSGLFGSIGAHGVVKNVSVGPHCNFNGVAFVGAIAGINEGYIENCTAIADSFAIHGYVGGLVGYNDLNGHISNCKLSCNSKVTCEYIKYKPYNIFVGRNAGTIKNCKVF